MDTLGGATGTRPALRGGCWDFSAGLCRYGNRSWLVCHPADTAPWASALPWFRRGTVALINLPVFRIPEFGRVGG